MKKITLFFMLLLCSSAYVMAQNFPSSNWSDFADTSWYDSAENEFDIATAEALAGLAELVEQGNDFDGITINLTADIDLDGNLWKPIGIDQDLPFSGVVEGNSKTISNLYINEPQGDFIGLFGRAFGAQILDVFLNNVTIVSGDTSGCLVGNLSSGSSVTNCHVSNASISINGYNGGGITGDVAVNSSILRSSFKGDVQGVKNWWYNR